VPGGPTEYSFDFTGKGFVLKGGAVKLPDVEQDYGLEVEVYIDGELSEEAVLPTAFQGRRHDVTWKYNLEDTRHQVKVVWKNPKAGYKIELNNVIVYGPEPSGI